MRTTLDIDDEVLALARARADREHVSIGRVISQLARTALQRPSVAATTRDGLPVLPCSHRRLRHARTRQPDARRGTLMAYLLDINVLIALLDAGHVQHEAAHEWFGRVNHPAWATCPLIENGVRIIALPESN
ncbi:hypothetical protein AB4Y40_33655 [Paraburkholderia sp. EG287B]|uniref:hypothetical protein n=1 Tax=Paraburkholderia sp. EG287B TaxID=3237010 RepID=UPI0034D1BB9F